MTRKTYTVPRMHYDVWEVWNNNPPKFFCSCSKENEALTIIHALQTYMIQTGCAYGQTTYKVRARATKEHTIQSVRV